MPSPSELFVGEKVKLGTSDTLDYKELFTEIRKLT